MSAFDEKPMSAEELAEAVAKAHRKWASEQALASASIEGFVPDVEFLADSEAIVNGTMTTEAAIQRGRTRALAMDRAAALRKG